LLAQEKKKKETRKSTILKLIYLREGHDLEDKVQPFIVLQGAWSSVAVSTALQGSTGAHWTSPSCLRVLRVMLFHTRKTWPKLWLILANHSGHQSRLAAAHLK